MHRAEVEQVTNLKRELPVVPNRLPLELVMDEAIENHHLSDEVDQPTIDIAQQEIVAEQSALNLTCDSPLSKQ